MALLTQEESRPRYVELDEHIGVTHLQMRDRSFLTSTAQRFSTFTSLDREDAAEWFERACKGGAVFG